MKDALLYMIGWGAGPCYEWLEQMGNDRVQDDQPMRRDPEREREPVHDNIDRP